MSKGEVVAIYTAPSKSAPLVSQNAIRAMAGKGLAGDRYFKQAGSYYARPGSDRQVTLIEIETLDALKMD